MMTTMTRCGCSESTSTWRMVDVVMAGAETTARSSVTRDSASAVSRSASSISLRARSRSTANARRRLAALADDDVHVVPVADVGGHAPRRRVRVGEHAHVLEVGEVVADGRGGDPEREVLAEVLRADRGARGDVLLDDGPQDPFLSRRERHLCPLKRQARNRRTHASPATYRPFRVTRIVPLCRETNPAAARRAAAARVDARTPPRAAGHGRRSAPRAAGARGRGRRREALDGSRRLAAGGQGAGPGRRVRGVRPAPGADGAHGAGAEAQVGPGAPVRQVVARLLPRQREVAHLVPVVAGAREGAHDAPVAGGGLVGVRGGELRREPRGERRPRRRRELVPGDVVRPQREHGGDVGVDVRERLAGDAVDEVERDRAARRRRAGARRPRPGRPAPAGRAPAAGAARSSARRARRAARRPGARRPTPPPTPRTRRPRPRGSPPP